MDGIILPKSRIYCWVLLNSGINIHVLKPRVVFRQSELLSAAQEWLLSFKYFISYVNIMWEYISKVMNGVLENED
jgi:hypothetical protein